MQPHLASLLQGVTYTGNLPYPTRQPPVSTHLPLAVHVTSAHDLEQDVPARLKSTSGYSDHAILHTTTLSSPLTWYASRPLRMSGALTISSRGVPARLKSTSEYSDPAILSAPPYTVLPESSSKCARVMPYLRPWPRTPVGELACAAAWQSVVCIRLFRACEEDHLRRCCEHESMLCVPRNAFCAEVRELLQCNAMQLDRHAPPCTQHS